MRSDFGRTIALVLAIGCTACHRDEYKLAGCQSTHALPPMPPVTPLWRSEHSVVCVIADNAERVPTCDAISTVYRSVNRPTWNYGIIVTRATREAAECQGMYAPSGAHIADLPQVE